MKETSDQGALTAATVSLIAGVGCIALFLPPWVHDTVATPLRAAATGAALGCTLLLHWIFLGIAVQRLQRSVLGWVSLSVLLLPIGSVLALVLLSWFRDEQRAGVPATASRG